MRPSALTAALALALIARTAPAETRIYLAEYKFNDPQLHAIGPGGAPVEELAIVPDADWLLVGVQVDTVNGHVYWTHGSFNQGRIVRANLDGSGLVPLVQNLTNPRGLALDLDGGKLYWSDTQDRAMYRANLDGTGMQAIVNDDHQLGHPTLNLAAGKIYFGDFDAGTMRRANLDGSAPETLFGGLFTPIAVALDLVAGKIYWADSNTSFVSNHIARANFDGTEMEILREGLPTSSGYTGIGLDLAAGKLYWSDEITDVEKGLWEADLDGTRAARIYASRTGWNAGAMTIVVDAAARCSEDLDGSGAVDFADLLAVLSAWGPCGAPCPEDLDASGAVDFGDLLAVLAAWGSCAG